MGNEAVLNPIEILGEKIVSELSADESAITVLRPWERSGAETYTTEFLLDRPLSTLHLIGKACVLFSSAEVVNEWLDRRKVVQETGIKVPKLYARDGGVIVEEFIPFDFKTLFKNSRGSDLTEWKDRFIDLVGKLFQSGFLPTGLHDLRTNGKDIVVIDFGSDLGSPLKVPKRPSQRYIDAQINMLTR